MAQDFGGVDGRPVEWLECLAERAGDLEALRRLVDQLPEQTLALREVAARFTAAVVERLRVEGDKGDLARFINNLSVRLGDLGRREEALEFVQEAVVVYRELSQSRPDAFRPDLASSLHNAAMLLRELGRPGEALETSEEAVRMLLPFFQAFPAAFRDWMVWMTSLYLKLSEENGRQPDPELIEEITSTFEKIQPPESPEPSKPSPDPGSPS
jgi:tetratricopeptide (TPR) repeat protein